MAEPIEYTPEPPKLGPDAHEELERLLQTAHEHGVLRLANDLIGANTQWAQVLVDGMNTEGAHNAVQNLAMLAMMLSRIDPNRFYKALFAARDGLDAIGRYQPARGDGKAPGVLGAYNLLYDDALWKALDPLFEALKVFAHGLEKDVQKPISEFTGKPARGP
jgi:uncharacterized protein YjgD (DUF1641 family)